MENTMRKILKALMDKHNDTPTSLSKKTVTGGQKGISQSTIFRFIKGDVKFITPETAKALAEVYGLTESQLRGDMPIDKEVLDIETKVYRVEDPVKQDIIDKLLELDRADDIDYVEKTIEMVTLKKEGGGREVMNRRKDDPKSCPIKERRMLNDRRQHPLRMVSNSYHK